MRILQPTQPEPRRKQISRCSVKRSLLFPTMIPKRKILDFMPERKVTCVTKARNYIRLSGQFFVNGTAPERHIFRKMLLCIIKAFTACDNRNDMCMTRFSSFHQRLVSQYHRCACCQHWITEDKNLIRQVRR